MEGLAIAIGAAAMVLLAAILAFWLGVVIDPPPVC
jgi:hypothetical protein